MAIIFKGNKLANLMYRGHKISTLWYKGKKIYSSMLSVGVPVWTGPKAFINSYDEVDPNNEIASVPHDNRISVGQTVTIDTPLKYIKNGVQINISSLLIGDFQNASSDGYHTARIGSDEESDSKIVTNKITLAQIKAKTPVKIVSSFPDGNFIYAQAVDDNHLKLYRTDYSNFGNIINNSTIVSQTYSGIPYFEIVLVLIDSITAY